MQIKVYLLALICAFIALPAMAENDFPLRAKFPEVTPISSDDLAVRMSGGKLLIVDVRSEFEFNTVSLNGAINIPISNANYKEAMAAKMPREPETALIYYCNGPL